MRCFFYNMCSEYSIDMICLEAEYFNVNRILLQAIGLWPFQQSKFARLQYIIIMITLASITLCQVKNNILLVLNKYIYAINFTSKELHINKICKGILYNISYLNILYLNISYFRSTNSSYFKI